MGGCRKLTWPCAPLAAACRLAGYAWHTFSLRGAPRSLNGGQTAWTRPARPAPLVRVCSAGRPGTAGAQLQQVSRRRCRALEAPPVPARRAAPWAAPCWSPSSARCSLLCSSGRAPSLVGAATPQNRAAPAQPRAVAAGHDAFDWRAYLHHYPDLLRPPTSLAFTQKAAWQHYDSVGRAEGRVASPLRLRLRYTTAGGLTNQLLAHLPTFVIARELGAEVVVPPAVSRPGFFRGNKEWRWESAETLLDLDKMKVGAGRRGAACPGVRCPTPPCALLPAFGDACSTGIPRILKVQCLSVPPPKPPIHLAGVLGSARLGRSQGPRGGQECVGGRGPSQRPHAAVAGCWPPAAARWHHTPTAPLPCVTPQARLPLPPPCADPRAHGGAE